MKQKKLKFEDHDIVVRKLPLRDYVQLIKSLKQIPLKLTSLQLESNDQLLIQLPLVIEECWDDFVGVFVLCTDMIEPDVNSDWFGLEEAVDVILAIIELNNYSAIYSKIKKTMGDNPPETKQT